jgi:hypothetical protein
MQVAGLTMADVTDRRDTIDRVGQPVHGVVLPRGPSARRDLRRRVRRSTLADAAAIATLRADLHALAASLHDVAAAIHDLRRDEHVQAFLHGFGDPSLHRQGAQRHGAAAAAERASAEMERLAARQRPAP